MRKLQLVVIGTLVVIILIVAFENGLSAEAFLGANPTSNTPAILPGSRWFFQPANPGA